MKLKTFIDENDDNDDDESECWYDAEDIGCQCTEQGVESSWEWDKEQGCWVCSSCGDVQ